MDPKGHVPLRRLAPEKKTREGTKAQEQMHQALQQTAHGRTQHTSFDAGKRQAGESSPLHT
ncbi:MAG: hypothetical protein QXX77_09175 [Candidatus Methanosuratincola sp.]